jgi:hypothetical protein
MKPFRSGMGYAVYSLNEEMLMFTTHRHAEIPLAPAIAGPHQLWRFVELEQHGPWFYVTINKGKNGENWRSMIFVASEDELEWALRDIAADARIETVQVITPTNLNGTGKWQMEELTELVRIYDAQDQVLGYDLKTASGNIYSDRVRTAAVDAGRAQIYGGPTAK